MGVKRIVVVVFGIVAWNEAACLPAFAVVGTNIFVYYDTFEQALALENPGAMLKTGGLLLTNDRLPEVPGGSMRLAGTTVVRSGGGDAKILDAIGWYRKQ